MYDTENLNTLKHITNQFLTEWNIEELLPSWFSGNSYEQESINNLLTAWKQTQEKLSNFEITENSTLQFEYKLNEIIERKIFRIIQMYQMIRLTKIFFDPFLCLEVQKQNPDAKILESTEEEIASRWADYMKDFNHTLLPINATDYTHITSAISNMDINLFKRMIQPVEGLDIHRKITAEATNVAIVENGISQERFVCCAPIEIFKQGLYKSRFHARK